MVVRISMTFMGMTDISRVREISVKSENSGDLSSVINAAVMAPNTRSYGLDLDGLNAKISSTPIVEKSSVRRTANGNIIVNVKLYKPVAIWTDGTLFYPISEHGDIIKSASDVRPSGILFRGEIKSDVNEILDTVRNLSDKIDFIERIENRRWDIYTTNGIRIMLPSTNESNAIANILDMEKKHNILSKELTTIDMRDDKRVLVK